MLDSAEVYFKGAEVIFKRISIQSLSPTIKTKIDFNNIFRHEHIPKSPISLPNFTDSEELQELNYLLKKDKNFGHKLSDLRIQREMIIWIETNSIDITQLQLEVFGCIYCRVDLYKSISSNEFV